MRCGDHTHTLKRDQTPTPTTITATTATTIITAPTATTATTNDNRTAIWASGWVNVLASAVSAEDFALWFYTVSLLVKWVIFLGSLHWPEAGADLGVGGVSYVELLILYELWDGVRFVLEKAHLRYLRPGRPISVSAVLFGTGIDILRSCRFVGSLMRSLCTFLGLFRVLLVLTIAGLVMLGG